jgi:hypothetical protein
VIAGMAILWYGLVPMIGGIIKRYKWFMFRKRFDELRLSPILDYNRYSQIKETMAFRFVGGFESVTDGHTLWIRSENLTVPVSLQKAETYLLPMQKGTLQKENSPPLGNIPPLGGPIPLGKTGASEMFDPDNEAPERIHWERVSSLTEGARVYVGGLLMCKDGRWNFISTKENPLLVIFYDGPDQSLATQAIRAGRHRGEYWNVLTPYSLVIGALCLILIAVLFLSRPAFRLTVIVSIITMFIPLYPIIPPGLFFTVIYRRLTWRSRILRAYSDLARLPLRYLNPMEKEPDNGSRQDCVLPNGERYGYVRCTELPPDALKGGIPMLLPEFSKSRSGDSWYIFGTLRPGEELPVQPEDSFATYGILPGKPKILTKLCAAWAYMLELAAWIMILAGIGLNIFFLGMILF